MAGKGQLGFPKMSILSLREQEARTTLRNVRMQGHTCVELREDGKKFIFFCTLCQAPCYSDSALFDHLGGNLHTIRYAAAKVTLLGPNPWPFNDGALFFNNSSEQDKQTISVASQTNQSRFLENTHDGDGSLAIVKYNGSDNVESVGVHNDGDHGSGGKNLSANRGSYDLVIPGVMMKDEVFDLELSFLGFGQIGARFREKDGLPNEIIRIWCEWLGKRDPADEEIFPIPEHDFAVVTFSYSVDMCKKWLFEDVRSLLCSSPAAEIENGEGNGRKRKESFSDPEDISETLSKQYDLHGEDSLGANDKAPRMLLDGLDDQLLNTSLIKNKSVRRELRRRQRAEADMTCVICQHKMLPGKDVAALLNLKTERLVCNSRNKSGAFHVYHISCLIHWILLFELEMIANHSISPKVERKPRRKSAAKCNEKGKGDGIEPVRQQIHSVVCPECQGTGINIEGNELEIPSVRLAEIFQFKIKSSDAHKAWMKSPEVLKNCSTGFHFPSQSEVAIQEKVSSLKLVHFYRACK